MGLAVKQRIDSQSTIHFETFLFKAMRTCLEGYRPSHAKGGQYVGMTDFQFLFAETLNLEKIITLQLTALPMICFQTGEMVNKAKGIK